MRKNKWWLNGGRGSGRTFRLLCEVYENQIADIKANCDLAIEGKDVKIMELETESNKLLDVINNQDVKIADLEKENAELRNNGFTVSAMTEQQLKVAIEKGEQLEKENAELQGSLELYENGCCRAEKECAIKDQLAQAKEIIRELLSWERRADYDYSEYDLIKDRAEQFLKEIEK